MHTAEDDHRNLKYERMYDERALATVLGNPKLTNLDTIQLETPRLVPVRRGQTEDTKAVGCQRLRLAPNPRIGHIVRVGDHADVARHGLRQGLRDTIVLTICAQHGVRA